MFQFAGDIAIGFCGDDDIYYFTARAGADRSGFY
jgi:hypothetical protein